MYEVGRAGAFVSGQMWRRRARAALQAALAMSLAVVAAGSAAIVAGRDAFLPREAAAVAGLAAAAGCWAAAHRSLRTLRRARQAAVGARSERQVRTVVRHTGSLAAAYGLVLGRRAGDCDVVVFTRGGGAVVIEVKTGHGEVGVDAGTMRVGRRVLRGNPVGQAADQSRRLSRRLRGRAVQAVVCVPGMTNRPFATSGGVWVCGSGDLPAVLDRAPRVFDSAAEAAETMRRLWAGHPDGAGERAGEGNGRFRASAKATGSKRPPARHSGRRR